jgi:hypothetical protein
MKPVYKLGSIVGVALLMLDTASVKATMPNGLNLGGTSFLDGGPPAGPGFYFTEYMQYYHADKLQLRNAPDPDIDLNVWASLSQFIYQSDQKILLGGKWGMDFILPFSVYDMKGGTTQGGLGDIYVGPYLQWDPIMGKNGPIFMHRFEAQIILPSGDFDRGLGNNVVIVDPYWSGTLFFTPKWTASTRVHFLWADENSKNQAQAGEAIHLNFATDYEVVEKHLRLGVNGYYYGQFNNDRVNGYSVDGTRSRSLGVGPGMLWSINQDNHLFFNAYFETAVENATEGMRFWLRWVHHF